MSTPPGRPEEGGFAPGATTHGAKAWLASAALRLSLPAAWSRALWPWAAVLAALLLLLSNTAASMVAIWARSETYTHAFVVPPIALWLVWRRRAELATMLPRPSPWVLAAMALAALAWFVGDLVVANALSQLAFTALLVLTVPALLGWAVTRALLFPLLFLFFTVPIGESLTPMLMQATADFTVLALRASGVPVYREGLQFVIPSGNWSVVEACSGIRYLMASFMVGSLFAYLNYRSSLRRAVFIAVSLLLPVLANWLRAYMIVMLGHLSDNRIATGVDHVLYGWVFFGVVIMAMFMIGARWAEPDHEPPAPGAGRGAGVSGGPAAWPVALVAILLIALPTLAQRQLVMPVSAQQPDLALPGTLDDGWQATDRPLTTWQPRFGDASAQARQSYRRGDARVGVFIAYYRDQNETRKLVSSTHVLVDSTDFAWNQLAQGEGRVAVDGFGLVPLRTADLLAAQRPGQAERDRLLVWRLYWVGGRLTTSDLVAKLFTAWQRLRGQGDESAMLMVYTAQTESGRAVPVLEAFLRANFRALDALLRAAAHPATESASPTIGNSG